MAALDDFLGDLRACTLCAASLPHGPRPIVQIGHGARILLIGQAPGRKVHASGIPWDDASGDTLRGWLGLAKAAFYDPAQVALLPMGFCYPGTGKSGDLPPRPECAPRWHAAAHAHMPAITMTVLIGAYAQAHYLAKPGGTLTETVAQFRNHAPDIWPLPHPSPRNRPWLARNPWFEADLLPALRARVAQILV